MRSNGMFQRVVCRFLPAVLAVCGLLALAGAFFARGAAAREISVRDGVLDIRQLDVDSGVFEVNGRWEFYPGALYSPEANSSTA